MSPRDFLRQLDVFVYFPHPDWVESFGRVVIEAMAAGVPVILPAHFTSLFNEAALYAEPHEVTSLVDRLMADPGLYDRQVRTAWAYVEERFGYSQHARRIEALLSG